jgi:hypothetical protein
LNQEIAYKRGIQSVDDIKDIFSNPRIRIAGMVIDKVDKIMHGIQLGSAGMHNQVKQWAEHGILLNLIEYLHVKGFKVFICSDHGNIEADGCGRPAEGALVESRGQRVRIYSDDHLRTRVKNQFTEAIEWPSIGLPENIKPLIAAGRTAFVRDGEKIVSHGGISLEEVIVPFIEVMNNER